MQSTNFGTGPVDWLKMGSYGAVTVAAWAISLIPTVAPVVQGLFASSALISASILVAETRRADRYLTWGEIHKRVDTATAENEIAYAAAALDQHLQSLYFGLQNAQNPTYNPTYNPEVTEADRKSLETALAADSAPATSGLTTYDPGLITACKELFASGKSKSWITENILGLRGREFGLEAIDRILGDQQ
jgi:heme exporter protein D